MKRFIIISALIVNLVNCTNANILGCCNHATIAYISEQHLTQAARKAVQKIYNGESLAKYTVLPNEDRYKILVQLEV